MVRDPFAEQDEPALEDVLDALCDEDCRTIVRNLQGTMTASDVSEACDVPLSTTYRKLDAMTDATLLEEAIEIRSDGRHTTRYRLGFDEVVLSIDEERRFDLTVSRPVRSADERLASMWSEISKEA
jgi:DNA-binding IclR family transcriptional regulator